VYSCDENWDPKSVLKISGRLIANASSNASRQNRPSGVFDRRHDRTYRLNQAITAVRYMKPRRIGTYLRLRQELLLGNKDGQREAQ
jgi:hypothetical protein